MPSLFILCIERKRERKREKKRERERGREWGGGRKRE